MLLWERLCHEFCGLMGDMTLTARAVVFAQVRPLLVRSGAPSRCRGVLCRRRLVAGVRAWLVAWSTAHPPPGVGGGCWFCSAAGSVTGYVVCLAWLLPCSIACASRAVSPIMVSLSAIPRNVSQACLLPCSSCCCTCSTMCFRRRSRTASKS